MHHADSSKSQIVWHQKKAKTPKTGYHTCAFNSSQSSIWSCNSLDSHFRSKIFYSRTLTPYFMRDCIYINMITLPSFLSPPLKLFFYPTSALKLGVMQGRGDMKVKGQKVPRSVDEAIGMLPFRGFLSASKKPLDVYFALFYSCVFSYKGRIV